MKTDILIIGAGLMGTAAARELSKYQDLDITLLEKGSDVCAGTSKATSAIVHSGYDLPTGSLRATLGVKGNAMYSKLCEDLEVPFKRIGSLLLAFNDDDMQAIRDGYENGLKNGVKGMRILDSKELHEMEPHLSKDAFAALYSPDCGIVGSMELMIALAENACANGVKLVKEAPVTGIARKDDLWHVQTPKGEFTAKYIINTAGVYADEIAKMAGDDTFVVDAYKGEEYLLDKNVGYLVNHVLETISVGADVLPTVHGNIMIGTTRYKVDKQDFDTTRENFLKIYKNAKTVIPEISDKSIITSFAGLRAINNHGNDYILGVSEKSDALINVSVGSPGIFAVPAIAEEVARLVGENWVALKEKPDFNPHREAIVDFKELTEEERAAWIAKDPRYGRVICRCQTVTEGQIVEAIRRGATTLDGIKYRVRAGMGRCQGGFCMPRILRIMERELGVKVTEITKKGKGSELMPYEVKEFLQGGKES